MIRKSWLLLKIQLLSLFGINRMLHAKEKAEKRRVTVMALSGLLILLILLVYSSAFSVGCAKFGLIHILPSFMLTITAVITLIFTFLKSSGVLFGLKDYDMVMSLPVSGSMVILSRLLSVYLFNFILSGIIMAPSIIVYGTTVGAFASEYLMMVLALFLAPLLPMIIAMVISAVITASSAHFRHKNLFALLLSIAAVLVIVIGMSSFGNAGEAEITAIGTAAAATINHIYPLAGLYANALSDNNWGSFGLLALISVGAACLFIVLLSKCYVKINTAVSSHDSQNNYRVGALKESTPFYAMYVKELRRFVSCTIYALNSSICLILLIVAGIAFVAMNPEKVALQLKMNDFVGTFKAAVPLFIALFISMSSTTSASLSLEGKSRWIMCAMPVESKTVFDSKIAVNLTTFLPTILLTGILLSIGLKLNFMQALFTFITPIVYAFLLRYPAC